MKQTLANHIKNIGGWTTKRKILCFAVDDYGNIRLHSPSSVEKLKSKGVQLSGRFDYLDALDTREDYEQLFEVLGSIKDKYLNPAIFTSYALSANIDFDKVLKERRKYEYELLPETYKKLAADDLAYEGAFEMLQEGIANKFIKPQFHGREHLNVSLFQDLLNIEHPHLMANLENRSYAGIPKLAEKPTVGFTQAFAFWDEKEVEYHKSIIKDGLRCFEKVYGYKSVTFTPPAQQLHPKLYNYINQQGVISIDKSRSMQRHLGQNEFIQEKNKLGYQNNQEHITMVRNVVFEPTEDRGVDWVEFTFKQIQAAFRLNKPVIVSSHRVNYCGHIDPENRTKGLIILKALLQKVVQKYPEVEFMSVDQLAEEINAGSNL
ncbi:hypothetical protein [Psychroflexus aestuariivivens]|uniref:hypothetical protein n=1 Tax=Psychroflexus aestuariivivens TaxID=1795040 RepID=UPI000FDB9599|nr:hypothetical protein [Psychroflexus aestuariivivens]